MLAYVDDSLGHFWPADGPELALRQAQLLRGEVLDVPGSINVPDCMYQAVQPVH